MAPDVRRQAFIGDEHDTQAPLIAGSRAQDGRPAWRAKRSVKMSEGTDVFRIHVECYAGNRGDETPRVLVIGGRRIGVVEVVDRWLAPAHRYFKVRGNDGGVYIVRYDNAADRWELTMFSQARRGG
jgi:hypothetical protein